MIPEGKKKHAVNKFPDSILNQQTVTPKFTVCVTNAIVKTDYTIADVEVLVLASV